MPPPAAAGASWGSESYPKDGANGRGISPKPESTDPRRRLGAQAHHLAARLLRSSFTQLRLRSLRCSAPDHDLAHLDTNSLVANRWIRVKPDGTGAALRPGSGPAGG